MIDGNVSVRYIQKAEIPPATIGDRLRSKRNSAKVLGSAHPTENDNGNCLLHSLGKGTKRELRRVHNAVAPKTPVPTF